MASRGATPLTQLLAHADLSQLPKELQDKLNGSDISKLNKVISAKSLSVLVTGKAGAGKSTAINGILGMRMGDDDYAEESMKLSSPGTLRLKSYTKKKGRIDVTVWDSRGLLDGTSSTEQEENLNDMASKCSKVDLKLVCIQMSVMRFTSSTDNPDVVVLIKLMKAFGKDFWDNAVVVLTFANLYASHPDLIDLTEEQKAVKFAERVQEWREQVHEIIREHSDLSEREIEGIKVIPAGHYKIPSLPDREYWLTNLWFECLDALPTPEAQGAMIDIGEGRIQLVEEEPSSIDSANGSIQSEFPPLYLKRKRAHHVDQPIQEKVLTVLACAASGGVSGAAVGLSALVAGPLGAAIGIPAGALTGLCIGLALGFHKIQEESMKKTQ